MPILDPIKRRLSLIDDHFAQKASLSEYFLLPSPFFILAAGFISGLIIQHHFNIPVIFAAATLLLCSFAVLFRKHANLQYNSVLLTLCTFLAFTSLGSIRLAAYSRPAPNDIRSLVAGRTLAKIRGTISTTPKIETRDQWLFAKYVWTDPATIFYMDLKQANTTRDWQDVKGTVRVQIAEPVKNIATGDHIQMHCWLDTFQPPSNPGQFDITKYLATRNVFVAANVVSATSIDILSKAPANSFTSIKNKLKTFATEALIGTDIPQNSTSPLLPALILGQRDYSSATFQAFQKTGLAHFICLSGMHMGILAGFVWYLCRFTGLAKSLRAVISIAIIILYMMVVPPRAATLRAAIICISLFLSIIIRQRPNPLNSLSFSAVALLLVRPMDIFSPGFQLSYATVLGILLLYPHISDFLMERTLDKTTLYKDFFVQKRNFPYFLKKLLLGSMDLLCVGIAAWLGGAGILLYHFGIITPLSALWTMLVFPLVLLVLITGFTKLLLAAVFPTLSVIVGAAANWISDLLAFLVRSIASFDSSQFAIGKTLLLLVTFYYLVLLFIRFADFKPPVKKTATALMLTILFFSLGITKYIKTPPGQLTLTCLNVGHGQAAVLSLPSKKHILFDTGSISTKNTGQRVLLPFLYDRGIDNIDAVVISHDDIDHINGLPEVVTRFPKTTVYATDSFLQQTKSRSSAAFLAGHLKELNINILPVDLLSLIPRQVQITSLWPTDDICADPAVSDNDKSLVCLIEYANKKILLCSDIEQLAQNTIIQKHPELTVDVILMPHHGSVRNLQNSFISSLNPKTVIISCSKKRTASAFKPPGNIRSFYTPIDGAVTVKIKADGNIVTTGFVNPNKI